MRRMGPRGKCADRLLTAVGTSTHRDSADGTIGDRGIAGILGR